MGDCEARPVRKADDLTAIYEPIVYKKLYPRRLTTLRDLHGLLQE
jgi:hypothetical protein